MRTTIEFLDALKIKLGVSSDYALAAKLGITRAAVSGYRTGRDCFGDEMAVTVGELLGINPAFVMACAHAERAKAGKVKNYWIAAAERMAAAVFLAVCIGLFIQPQQAYAQGFSTAAYMQTDCTLCAIRCFRFFNNFLFRLRRHLSRFFALFFAIFTSETEICR